MWRRQRTRNGGGHRCGQFELDHARGVDCGTVLWWGGGGELLGLVVRTVPAEAPVLRRAHEEYGDQVRFIGVAVDDTAADAFDFMESFGISFQNYLGDGSSMREQYGAFGIPFTVFTDSAGDVLNVHRGIIDEGILSLWTDELSRLG